MSEDYVTMGLVALAERYGNTSADTQFTTMYPDEAYQEHRDVEAELARRDAEHAALVAEIERLRLALSAEYDSDAWPGTDGMDAYVAWINGDYRATAHADASETDGDPTLVAVCPVCGIVYNAAGSHICPEITAPEPDGDHE